MARRLRPLVAVAGLSFVASGVLDALRAASQIVPLTDYGLVRLFFTSTGYGRLTLLKVAVTLVWFVGFCLIGGGWRRLFVPLSTVGAVVVIYTVSGASHAAAKPGLVPLVSDMIHLFASAIWGGGIVYLGRAASALRRGELARAPADLASLRVLYAMMERFSTLALVCVGLVTATGAIAAYLHVYDVNAVVSTPYGRAFAVKMALFVAVLGVAGYNLMIAAPALRRELVRGDAGKLDRIARAFDRAVKIEAVIVAGLLIAAGVLTTLPPADTPGTVIEGRWERSISGIDVAVELAPLDRPGGLGIGVTLSREGAPLAADARVELLLEMTSHKMAVGPITPARIAPGRYEAETLLPMDGSWRLTVRLEEAGRSPVETSVAFEASAGSMLSGRIRRWEPAAALRTPVRQFVTGLGVILLVLGGYAVMAGRRRRLVASAIPLGLAMLTLGGYHVMSTTLTDAIPTSHIPNPVPYTLDAVQRGAELYAAHCAVCHGVEGKGDGLLADSLSPRPADLTADHVDEHTDGDIFWWITHGIDETAMPAMGNVLTEEERWTIIHFVRSLRHFTPALEDPRADP